MLKHPAKYSIGSRICVVGAACSLKGKNLGGKIDSHDEVVRVNNHAVEGYEKEVGSKTTILSTFDCPASSINGSRWPWQRGTGIVADINEFWWYLPTARIIPQIKSGYELCRLEYFNLNYEKWRKISNNDFKTTTHFIYGSPSWSYIPKLFLPKKSGRPWYPNEEEINSWLLSVWGHKNFNLYFNQQPNLWGPKTKLMKASTGFMAIMMAIYRWGKISIAGFGMREQVRLGYYNKDVNIEWRKKKTSHNYEVERKLLNSLENRKIICRLDS